ncbi:MAG: hypothetical protein M0P01_12940 [Treponema sp.]|nr:hypothetical protein [Treponema sp.]
MNKLFFSMNIIGTALLCAVSAAALPFNSRLSDSEKLQLAEGKVLIRNIDYASKMSLDSSNPGAQKILRDIAGLHPSYLAEVIQVRPYAGNEDLPQRLVEKLMNIREYAGIPYYSEQGDKWYDLYSSAEIVSDTLRPDGTTHDIKADLTMEPFGTIHTTIELDTTPDYVYYVSTNDNELWYFDKFKCVNQQKMKSAILLFRDGDNWVLYGTGGVNAIKLFFLERRIETSFINRIKTFCNYMFDKI